ncbi:hypothetical protein PMAYCL1PPCAC_10455, partial [Pristionchus mayeri]
VNNRAYKYDRASTMPKNCVVTGANRGIGLGLVKELLKNSEVGEVFATTRHLSKSPELRAIKDSRLIVVEMDVENDESIRKAAQKIGKWVGSEGIDFLINNAG